MNNVGAQVCVYEDSGSLREVISRAYPYMDKFLILLNYDPWCGKANLKSSFETYEKARDIPDPDGKILLISQHWKTEAIQRNFAKDLLHKMGIKWSMVLDDDELYNPEELENAVKYLQTTEHGVILVRQQVYWKTKEFCIENLTYGMPTFVISDLKKAYFDYCRNVRVDGTWDTLSPDLIINHHLSYVRTNEQLLRKIETFSHGDEERKDGKDTVTIWKNWFENIWLKWTIDMRNLHVNPDEPQSFSKAIESKNSKYQIKY